MNSRNYSVFVADSGVFPVAREFGLMIDVKKDSIDANPWLVEIISKNRG